jgi:hypothetical protein
MVSWQPTRGRKPWIPSGRRIARSVLRDTSNGLEDRTEGGGRGPRPLSLKALLSRPASRFVVKISALLRALVRRSLYEVQSRARGMSETAWLMIHRFLTFLGHVVNLSLHAARPSWEEDSGHEQDHADNHHDDDDEEQLHGKL